MADSPIPPDRSAYLRRVRILLVAVACLLVEIVSIRVWKRTPRETIWDFGRGYRIHLHHWETGRSLEDFGTGQFRCRLTWSDTSEVERVILETRQRMISPKVNPKDNTVVYVVDRTLDIKAEMSARPGSFPADDTLVVYYEPDTGTRRALPGGQLASGLFHWSADGKSFYTVQEDRTVTPYREVFLRVDPRTGSAAEVSKAQFESDSPPKQYPRQVK